MLNHKITLEYHLKAPEYKIYPPSKDTKEEVFKKSYGPRQNNSKDKQRMDLIYYRIMDKYKPLDPEMEINLVRKMKSYPIGSKEYLKIRDLLLFSNMRFIKKTALEFAGPYANIDDLIQTAIIGFYKGIERFDETRGFKLISYAVSWIKQSLHEYIDKNSRNVRLPLNKINDKHKVHRAINLLGENANIYDLSKYLGVPVSKIEKILTSASPEVRLFDNPGGTDRTYIETIVGEDPRNEFEERAYREHIWNTISNSLEGRELFIIVEYYFKGKTLNEIGAEMKLTRERVRQLREKALERLRKLNKMGKIDLSLE